MVGHTGNGSGFKSTLLLFPDDDLTVAVLTNTDTGSALGVAARIARAALHLNGHSSATAVYAEGLFMDAMMRARE